MRRLVIELQQNGNYDLIPEMIHPEFEDHTPDPGLSPYYDGVKSIMMLLHQTLGEVKIEILSMVSDGETVATHKVLRGIQLGDLTGKPATNAPIQMVVMDFMKFKDGKVKDHWATRGAPEDIKTS